MSCAEDHVMIHVPPSTSYKSGRFIILCGNDLLATFELEAGVSRSDVETWGEANLRRHVNKEPRPCKRMNGGSWCYGQSHPECVLDAVRTA